MNLQRTIEVARAAARLGEPGPLYTEEALTAALVLNRHDWLAEMGYTIAQALGRIDSNTVQHLQDAERAVRGEAP
ncbi:hypothetical protein XarzCFBP7410_01700 [Xanthomonas arboricola pv. zantedeschiae]|uniref:hypothetical protein n=1 Tax=Xanthomonas arboricola TaxID=56448 RepID=UPI000CEDE810|nr:hypothetical protein [Xanthomonas arboricola]PPT85960.1 hypothetical protein XarzCFBP7410_01700 [Xanthomonas arboricola pv. zantedeschiae]